jgi:Transmembrane secretion effector
MFLAAITISMVGAGIQRTSILWDVWQSTHSVGWLTVLSLLNTIPLVAFSVASGTTTDRFGHRRLLLLAQCSAITFALGLAALSNYSEGVPWINLIFVFLASLTSIVLHVSSSAVVKVIARPDELPSAIKWSAVLRNLAATGGPLVAGWFLLWTPASVPFALSALCHVGVLIAIKPLALPSPAAGNKRIGVRGILAETVSALHLIVSDHRARVLIMTIGCVSFLGRPIQAFVPAFNDAFLGGGVLSLSWLAAVTSLGPILGGLWIGACDPRVIRQLLKWDMIAVGIAMTSLVMPGMHGGILGAMLAVGILFGIDSVGVQILLQRSFSDEHAGRVMGVYVLMFLGLAGVGAGLFGLLISLGDLGVATGVSAAILIGLGALAAFSRNWA